MTNDLRSVRYVGYAEGTSFLLLLGIAMPLKYYFATPEAVLVVGWAHGVLFVLYAFVAFRAFFAKKLTFIQLLAAALASLIPFGPFVFDASLRRTAPANHPTTTDGA